ncbi:ROK family transcriptional regulator [Anaerosinus massiliensis]|uniref:ROK family transcriptional regulator n=1 Tax=Massilibacillus massiliensis TaxID=1806837 RepID=UPI000A431EE5|nr:ROK family transcriptional regulator [Massilibacillus massiliensis]
MRSSGNSKTIKRMNQMAILNVIKDNELISRQQIAEHTGLTAAAVTGIVRDLIAIGFVKEVGLGESQGGRRPVHLKFNGKAGYVLGVEVTSDEITLAVADFENIPREIKSFSIDMKDPDTAIAALKKQLGAVFASKENQKKNFLSIAIAFPAIVQSDTGVVKRAVNLGEKWNGYPLKHSLEEAFHIPVFIDTNSKVAALGEKWFGGGVHCKNLIYVNLGEGISAGILMNDVIVQGAQGYAGQIGHTVLMPDGPLCNCGNRGCLEAICGIPALLRRVETEISTISESDILKRKFIQADKNLKINDILEAADLEDSYARNLLRETAQHVAVVTASMINICNPDKVFLGGKLAIKSPFFIKELRSFLNSHVFPEIGQTTQVMISNLGANSGVIGACALALTNLLRSPNSKMISVMGKEQ